MEKLCALMSRCLPQDCKTMLETAFRVFFGDGIGKELEETFDAKNYDNFMLRLNDIQQVYDKVGIGACKITK